MNNPLPAILWLLSEKNQLAKSDETRPCKNHLVRYDRLEQEVLVRKMRKPLLDYRFPEV
jgi:hypothetical protein